MRVWVARVISSIKHAACPAGTYLSSNTGSCSMCPANSVSEEEGLAQCACMEGYYRAPQGEEDLPCIRKHNIIATWGIQMMLYFILNFRVQCIQSCLLYAPVHQLSLV